ncbi:MAG: hypothetical protein N2Z74_01145 [Syntrophales bacterium]|nr:hypothetical protein [Syntrophales bacterium]
MDISVRTVERVLAEEGFPKLPRRTHLKIGLNVGEAETPKRSEGVSVAYLDGQHLLRVGGRFSACVVSVELRFHRTYRTAGLPGSKDILAVSYFLTFLAQKFMKRGAMAYGGITP